MNSKQSNQLISVAGLCLLLFLGLYSQLGSNIWPLLVVIFVGLVGVAVLYSIITQLVSLVVSIFATPSDKLAYTSVYDIISKTKEPVECTIARSSVILGYVYHFSKSGILTCKEVKEGWELYHPAFKNGSLKISWLPYDSYLCRYGYELVLT